jgi:hypothetical protein
MNMREGSARKKEKEADWEKKRERRRECNNVKRWSGWLA